MVMHRACRIAATVVSGVVLLAACSSSPEDAASSSTTEPTGPTDTTASPETTETSAPREDPAASYAVITIDGEVRDPTRDRRIPYRIYAPAALTGDIPVILVSHGGTGSESGYTRAPHLGSTFAAAGLMAMHVGHLPSATDAGQLFDRPADVTFLLDQLETGDVELPDGFAGAPDLARVGHTGHSFGAYTSHAVGGATYATGTFRDPRIDAIAPISPQGADQFGAYDRGPDDSTWRTVTIPAYNLVGGAEVDTNAIGSLSVPGWRLTPFGRYPGTADTFLTVIDGQTHSDMWNSGSDEVATFIAQQMRDFFLAYVAGSETIDACGIGEPTLPATTDRRAGSGDSLLQDCPTG